MKTIDLKDVSTEEEEALKEALIILNSEYSEVVDYDLIGEQIVEYDLSEEENPIYWNLVNTYYNEDGTISRIELDC